MAETGALPRLNQSQNRAQQAKMEERQGMALAAQGKIALDGAFRNSILTDSRNFLRDIVGILEYAEEMRARDARQAEEDRRERMRKPVGSAERDKDKKTELDPFGVGAFLGLEDSFWGLLELILGFCAVLGLTLSGEKTVGKRCRLR